MQAFAGDRPGLLPTRFQRALSTSISNEKRMNLLPPFECLNTRHWPVFNDQAGVISSNAISGQSQRGLPYTGEVNSP